MAFGFDGSIKIDTSMNTKGFNTGINSMMASVTKLGAAIGVALSVAAVVAFGKSAVNEASNMASALIGLQSVVEGTGNSFAKAQEFIKSYVADGLVPAQDAMTAYKNLLMRGYDTSQIEKTLIALKNSSAFGRQSTLSLGQAVRSATEGLKNENSILVDNAGVTKNVSMMWKDYAASIGVGVDSLTKAQKIQAEVSGIIEETRFQMGDAAKLTNTYAGQISALGVSITNLKVAIGNSIIPMIQAILPLIRAVVDQLTAFFTKLATIMSLLFEVDMTNQTQGMAAVAEGSEDAANAQEDLANSTNKATKAAKGSLAAFDKLNVLQQAVTKPETTAVTAPKVAAPEATKTDKKLEELREKVRKFKEEMAELFGPAIAAFWRFWDATKPLRETLWEGLVWVWENVLVPFGKWTISVLLPKSLDLLSVSLQLLNDVIIALKPAALWLWDNILKPGGEILGAVLAESIQVIIDGLTWLHTTLSNNSEAFKTFLTILVAAGLLILAVATGPIGIIIAIIGILIGIVILLKTHWSELGEKAKSAWNSIVNSWKGSGDWFRTNVTDKIRDAMDSLVEWLKSDSIYRGLKDFVKKIGNFLIGLVNSMIIAVVGGINTAIRALNSLQIEIPDWVPEIGGMEFGLNLNPVYAPAIPYLATGAVIPPNAQFLAVLGDQRSGRNIEAPEHLIRQIVQEEMGNVTADINIEFTGSLGELARQLRPEIVKENVRIGTSLVQTKVTP